MYRCADRTRAQAGNNDRRIGSNRVKSNSLIRHLAGGVAAAVLIGAGPVLAAQPPSELPGVPALDPGNISGLWFKVDDPVVAATASARGQTGGSINPAIISDASGNPVPLLPWAEELSKKRLQDAKDGNPFAHTKSRCLPAGLPKSMAPPNSLPLQILITPKQVTVLFEEFNDFRTIHMDQKTHPEDPDPSFFGHSIGHWEGDTLVVDSIAIKTVTTIDTVGIPHSDALHVVERIRRTGPNKLEDVMTIDDPKTFARPWTMRASFKSTPGAVIGEYYCENDRNTPNEAGVSGVQMPGAQ
jgi:hypothetical protein